MKRYYITTPIYYVNGEPHIGHAYTTIAADVAARFNRLRGYDVFFLTGTDEHGINIARVAERNGVSPQAWADRIAGEFRRLWQALNISNDDFIRTTEPRHHKVAQHVFERLYRQGDIYLGTYEGWYCPSCESYYPETELGPDHTCPVHTGRTLEWTAEEAYLFRLSKYRDWLLRHIEAHPTAVAPDGPRSEVLSLLRSGLKDIAVSRATFTWGVPVPFDPTHVIYVWIDALTNYITAAGLLDDPEKFGRYWPADVHLVGKEIVRFHAVIWPIVLHAAGIPVPKQTFAHGWLTFGGQKFSKSLGTVIDPVALSREIAAESGAEFDVAVDALRYFLLREIPFGADGDFSKQALITGSTPIWPTTTATCSTERCPSSSDTSRDGSRRAAPRNGETPCCATRQRLPSLRWNRRSTVSIFGAPSRGSGEFSPRGTSISMKKLRGGCSRPAGWIGRGRFCTIRSKPCASRRCCSRHGSRPRPHACGRSLDSRRRLRRCGCRTRRSGVHCPKAHGSAPGGRSFPG